MITPFQTISLHFHNLYFSNYFQSSNNYLCDQTLKVNLNNLLIGAALMRLIELCVPQEHLVHVCAGILEEFVGAVEDNQCDLTVTKNTQFIGLLHQTKLPFCEGYLGGVDFYEMEIMFKAEVSIANLFVPFVVYWLDSYLFPSHFFLNSLKYYKKNTLLLKQCFKIFFKFSLRF